jgi:hypothetical protein
MEAGLVEGEHLSVDGSFIQANASRSSRIPREQLAEVAHVKGTVREYLVDIEKENPVEEPAHQQDQVSTTDSGFDLFDQGQSSCGTRLLQQTKTDRLSSVFSRAARGHPHPPVIGTDAFDSSVCFVKRVPGELATRSKPSSPNSSSACSCSGYDYVVCGMSATSSCWPQPLRT